MNLLELQQGLEALGITNDIEELRGRKFPAIPFSSSGGHLNRFVQLFDTPSGYTNAAGKLLRVNAAGNRVIFSNEMILPLDMGDNPITDIGYMDFNLVNGIEQAEGRLVWNDDEGTLNLGMKGGIVNLQIGQETLFRAKNASGMTIENGMAVRITGGTADQPNVDLSDASTPAEAGSIGLATEEIDSNQFGYITTFGLVRDINTSGTPVGEIWNVGDRLFVGNTPGELTNVSPTSTERIIFIGVIIRKHATEGVIWVSPINVSYVGELSGNHDGAGGAILNIDTENNRVGIGTDAPEAGLAIHVSTTDPDCDEALVLKSTDDGIDCNIFEVQDSSGAALAAIHPKGDFSSIYTAQGTGDTTFTGQLVIPGSNLAGLSGGFFSLKGITGTVNTEAGNNAPAAIRSKISWFGDASATNLFGWRIDNDFRNTASVTNYKALLIDITPLADTSSITNLYGIYVEDANIADVLNYSIYTNLGDVRFGDDVILGGADSDKLWFGAGKDMSLYYDGEDGFVKTSEVAPSDLHLTTGAAKTLVLDTPVWDDIRVPVSSAKRLGFSDPDWVEFKTDGAGSKGVYVLAFDKNTDQEVFFAIQMPHGWKLGTDLNPHLHWSPSDTDTGSVTWKLEYTIANINGTFGNTATLSVTDAADGVPHKHQYVDLGNIDMSSFTATTDISIILMCRLYRDVSDGDDYDADAFFLEIDFHYEIDTIGSRTEGSK